MGRDKARLRLGGRTMLEIVKGTALETGWPIRVVRGDLVKDCGPLGGVLTAFKSSAANWILFLACDMPFVRQEMLVRLASKRSAGEPLLDRKSTRLNSSH